MKLQTQVCDAYILDTYRQAATGKYVAGALLFKGRKKIDMIQWRRKEFDSQEQANAFVRHHFLQLGITEKNSEAELVRISARW